MGESNRARIRRRARERLAAKSTVRRDAPPPRRPRGAAPPPRPLIDESGNAYIGGTISAVCPGCGLVLHPDLSLGPGSSVAIEFVGSNVRCHVCGALAPIPDGIYGFRNFVTTLVESATEADKVALRDALADVDRATTDGAQLADVIESAGSHWRQLAEFMRPKSGADVVAYLGTLLAVLFYFFPPK